MYTDNMRRAVRSLAHLSPKGFYLEIRDNDNFLSVRASEPLFMKLTGEDKRKAVEYMAKIKDALEQNGAMVLLVREGGVEDA
jgi:hypothetical protein